MNENKDMKQNPNPRTIKELAVIAGVSSSTVSRALNNSTLISLETRTRIQDLAKKYKLQIHYGAKNLRLKETKVIGLITMKTNFIEYGKTNPFVLQMIGAMTNSLNSNDYDLLFIQVSEDDLDWPGRYYMRSRVDGFIILCNGQNKLLMNQLLEINAPFVVFGTPFYKEKYGGVMSDNAYGAKLATNHLIKNGCKKIGFIGGPDYNQEVAERFAGYKSALKKNKLKIEPKLIKFGNYTSKSGADCTNELLNTGITFDAVFINSDVMAISALSVLEEKGFSVPENIQIIGFDDIALAAYSSPSLTTVRQDINKAGMLLVDYIIKRIKDNEIIHTVLPVKLIIRESSP